MDCISTSKTAAELFYEAGDVHVRACDHWLRRVPFLVVLRAFAGCALRKGQTRKCARAKDKFIVTVTAIIFLMYPTMCEKAFAMFSCKTVGGIEYLQVT